MSEILIYQIDDGQTLDLESNMQKVPIASERANGGEK